MGRKTKPKTTLMRIRIVDAEMLKHLARRSRKSFPDYISKLTRGLNVKKR